MRNIWPKILILLALGLFISIPMAGATTVNFGDTNNYWPGWANNFGDNDKDTIGTPNYIGGFADVKGGYLTGLTINLKAEAYLDLWSLLGPSDLFIDTNANEEWDFLVNTYASLSNGYYDLYSMAQPLKDSSTDGNYIISYMPGYGYREDHPIGLDLSTASNTGEDVYFSGWPSKPGSTEEIVSIAFTFGQTDILLGDDFTIGFTIATCANDVIYETMANPVPEPATMLLLGTGLIGLAGFGRRKFFRGKG